MQSIPKDEVVWHTVHGDDGAKRLIITSKQMNRFTYFAYTVLADGSFKKVGKGSTPDELIAKYLKD